MLAAPLSRPAARISNKSAFAGAQIKPQARRIARVQPAARGASTKVVAAASYICVDCGYIYDGSEGPFEKLPNNYKCPACNSPKRRFKAWNGPGGKNDPKTMKTRMQQLKSNPAAASSAKSDSNPAVLVGAGVVLLAALYFALNGYYN